MAYYQYNIICTREEPRVMTPLISKVKIIPMQELGGQRGEGAYFRENTVLAAHF